MLKQLRVYLNTVAGDERVLQTIASRPASRYRFTRGGFLVITGKPPTLQDAAVQTLPMQAEALCRDWAA